MSINVMYSKYNSLLQRNIQFNGGFFLEVGNDIERNDGCLNIIAITFKPVTVEINRMNEISKNSWFRCFLGFAIAPSELHRRFFVNLTIRHRACTSEARKSVARYIVALHKPRRVSRRLCKNRRKKSGIVAQRCAGDVYIDDYIQCQRIDRNKGTRSFMGVFFAEYRKRVAASAALRARVRARAQKHFYKSYAFI